MLTYEQAREAADRLKAAHDAASKPLEAFPKGPLGLTPDAVKQTPEWRTAYAAERKAFEAMRQANAYLVKHYGRRYRTDKQAEIMAERMAKLGKTPSK